MTQTTGTIAAIATPPGRGGIGVVRVSGINALSIAKSILKTSLVPRKAYFGFFYDVNDEILDQGIALFFKAPHSFTGEDVLELHGHGSPMVLDRLLQSVLAFGAKLARPGEFSERAFLNDKIDLFQAEAIADLIDASSKQAAQSAMRSLQGEFSKCIHTLVNAIIDLRTFIEASIDFSEEAIDFLTMSQTILHLDEILSHLKNVMKSAKQGSVLREGLRIVIVGKPNVGKSSLMNGLSQQDLAIVTDIAGTTRDVIREQILIDGIPFYIFDTAGLQKSENIIEQEGIRRTLQGIEQSDHILFMVDDEMNNGEPNINHSAQNLTILRNKIDLTAEKAHIEKWKEYSVIYLSAKTGEGIDLLRNHLKELAGFNDQTECVFMARRRHLNALERAQSFLLEAKQQLSTQHTSELVAENLRQAQLALSEITGEFTTDDLLNEIFSSFCVGK